MPRTVLGFFFQLKKHFGKKLKSHGDEDCRTSALSHLHFIFRFCIGPLAVTEKEFLYFLNYLYSWPSPAQILLLLERDRKKICDRVISWAKVHQTVFLCQLSIPPSFTVFPSISHAYDLPRLFFVCFSVLKPPYVTRFSPLRLLCHHAEQGLPLNASPWWGAAVHTSQSRAGGAVEADGKEASDSSTPGNERQSEKDVRKAAGVHLYQLFSGAQSDLLKLA